MKNILRFFFLPAVICLSSASAQQVMLQSYDLNQFSLARPILSGSADGYVFVADVPDPNGTPLYIFDSLAQLVRKIYLPTGVYAGKAFAMAHAVRFTWYPLSGHNFDSAKIQLVQVSPKGVVTSQATISVSDRPGVTPTLINDQDNRLQLLYAFEAADSNKVFFRGLLLDTAGQAIKHLSYAIDFDKDLNQAPYVTVDTRGNIHILVLDRLSSYRISSNVTINTIPFAEEALASESFSFERVKLNKVVLTDNPSNNTIRLQGFYYDAQQKNAKKGLASISFPYERGVAMELPKFSPFPDDLRVQLRKSMSHLRAKDDPLNSLRLKEVLVQGGKTVFNYWMQDVSELDFSSEFDLDMQRDNNSWARSTGPYNPSQQQNLSRWLNDEVRLNKSMIFNPSSLSVYYYPEFISYRYPVFSEPSLVNPVVGNGLSSDDKERIFERLDRNSNTGPAPRKMKLVSFIIQQSGLPGNYSIIDPLLLGPLGENRMGLASYPLLYNDKLYFTANTPVVTDKRQFVLLRPDGIKAPEVNAFDFPFPAETTISRPLQIGRSRYVAVVRDAVQASYGLLSYEIR